MWILTFALLTVYGVVSDATDICEKGREFCFTANEDNPDFPNNIEALDKMCPNALKMLSCLVDYINQCGTDHSNIDENLEKVYELASDACDKDSELHRELSIQLPCLARITMSHADTCNEIVEDAVEAVQSRILGDDEGSDDPEERKKQYCLNQALHAACFLAKVAVTCGEEAKELVGIMLDRTGFLDEACHADIREELKEMISVMQVEMGEQLSLREFISEA